jgi:uncharacterized protein
MNVVAIQDTRTGEALAEQAGWCSSLWSRFRGLMFRRSLPPGGGIVLVPCGSVHMAFMWMALDVVYVDRDLRVVKLVSRLKPYRLSFGGRRAHAAIELPAGTLDGTAVAVGDALRVTPSAGAQHAEPLLTRD